ncbi:IclR family transcriptional regulator [Desulfobotulus alkaliphilus]|uniref:IclR family transcriptional regulator n=1 Tax=Desulfobotulus alkaliphilus TaxID=622671 RepID=A0A562S7T4_9BACT|nr:IclR family transcriptional regulator [Desulfobotulus alkaliphilus]TWI77358.1 IclR family transcriptional regulator [Desulfobotulus alkaliphilus]
MSIQSVQRALRILSFFSSKNPRLGITDVSKQMGLPKPTVHGLMQTLHEEGFLQQDPETRKYGLGLKIYELGTYLSATLKINQVGMAPTRRLAETTRRMARLAIWDRNAALVTMNLFPHFHAGFQHHLGPRLPAYCTALGKVMLAALPEESCNEFMENTDFIPFTPRTRTEKDLFREEIRQIRLTGFATESEEYMNGMSCIAAPVWDSTGECAGAISISDSPALLSGPDRDHHTRDLLATAMEVSRALGYLP